MVLVELGNGSNFFPAAVTHAVTSEWIMITSQRLSFRSLDRSSLLRCGGGAFQLEFSSSHSCGGERKPSGHGGRPL